MPTDSALQALSILRNGSLFQWYVIPLFVLAVYVYAVEIERQSWSMLFAGLAFWGMDWFNEIWNGLVFHFTNYAPVWGAPGGTAYLILIGYLPFFLVSFWVYDMQNIRRQAITVTAILCIDIIGLIVFLGIFKWI